MSVDNIKILYVDDEPINLELFALTYMGKFDVLTAESGTEGLELLDNNNDIQVVISDLKMPEMNGLEFITLANEKFSNISYLILSGYDKTQQLVDAIENKLIKKYFMKPFDKFYLEAEIKKCVSA